MHRRSFLQLTALSTLHWSVLGERSFAASSSQAVSLFPAGDLLDLPRGFHYQILQRAGDAMSDGHIMPIQPDGMCCLKGKAGQWVLLRNHEIGQEGLFERYGFRTSWVPDGGPSPSPLYREQFFGGVSRVVLNPRILRSELAVGANEATTSLVSRIWRWVAPSTTVREVWCPRGGLPAKRQTERIMDGPFWFGQTMTPSRLPDASRAGAG